LGCSTLEGYASSNSSFGTIVGRFANRIGGAEFELGGKKYQLDKNDGKNCLHGGFDRYEKKLWDAKKIENENGTGVEFSRFSPDGEQNFPGNLELKVLYTLNEKNELTLEYFAKTDRPTPVNLTNHAYFNLKGYNGGSVEDQELQMDSSKFVEVGGDLIPTGRLVSVDEKKAFDFRVPKLLGRDMKETGAGYDHAYCIDSFDGKKLVKFAVLKDPASGRFMEVSTTLPACQIYTANFVEGIVGKNGFVHHAHDAVCMETESYPDSPNHAEFPSCIVTPEKPYHEITVYKFGIKS
jgi:aldose 1-epimerase